MIKFVWPKHLIPSVRISRYKDMLIPVLCYISSVLIIVEIQLYSTSSINYYSKAAGRRHRPRIGEKKVCTTRIIIIIRTRITG